MNSDAADNGGINQQMLGYGGLIPFALGTAVLSLGFRNIGGIDTAQALLVYGVIIFTFMGAIWWGLGLRTGGVQRSWLSTLAVIPALLAWPIALMPEAAGLVLLAIGLVGQYRIDSGLALHPKLAPLLDSAYLKLRLRLTSVAAISLLISAVLVATHPGV